MSAPAPPRFPPLFPPAPPPAHPLPQTLLALHNHIILDQTLLPLAFPNRNLFTAAAGRINSVRGFRDNEPNPIRTIWYTIRPLTPQLRNIIPQIPSLRQAMWHVDGLGAPPPQVFHLAAGDTPADHLAAEANMPTPNYAFYSWVSSRLHRCFVPLEVLQLRSREEGKLNLRKFFTESDFPNGFLCTPPVTRILVRILVKDTFVPAHKKAPKPSIRPRVRPIQTTTSTISNVYTLDLRHQDPPGVYFRGTNNTGYVLVIENVNGVTVRDFNLQFAAFMGLEDEVAIRDHLREVAFGPFQQWQYGVFGPHRFVGGGHAVEWQFRFYGGAVIPMPWDMAQPYLVMHRDAYKIVVGETAALQVFGD